MSYMCFLFYACPEIYGICCNYFLNNLSKGIHLFNDKNIYR